MGQEVVHEAAAALAPAAQAKGLFFEVIVPETPVVLRTDRRSLRQILLNLAGNAVKFTREGGVRIELRRSLVEDLPATAILVRDTGVGIREEDRPRLFQAFGQLETTATQRHEGSGLGLHLSQKLAMLLGAEIEWESEVGKGSTFMLVFREES